MHKDLGGRGWAYEIEEKRHIPENQVRTATLEYLCTARWKLPESDEEPVLQTLSDVEDSLKDTAFELVEVSSVFKSCTNRNTRPGHSEGTIPQMVG